jgi:hypothetical protein
MVNNKSTFITIGRTSTYGLKIWEKTKPDLKGGTIRDIVKECLESSSVPMHKLEIHAYVQKYRNTTCHSMVTNLRMNGEINFVFFGDVFIGLKDKKYPAEWLSLLS